jgi:hypothetical protein
MAEIEACKNTILDNKIRDAYEAYTHDHFIIPHHLSSLFTSRTVHQHFKLDIDSKQCWINSYNEAVATKEASSHCYAEAAKLFFKPKRPPDNDNQPQPHTLTLSSSVQWLTVPTSSSESPSTLLCNDSSTDYSYDSFIDHSSMLKLDSICLEDMSVGNSSHSSQSAGVT